MDLVSHPTQKIAGTVQVPGDKSISHRALLLGALAEGTTDVYGFLPGQDCLATLAALEALGIGIERRGEMTLHIHGRGLQGLRAPSAALDMGNSGTAMRLMAGVLAAQPFDAELVGDASLSRRPMERVAEPLRRMGAGIETAGGRPPLRISGGRTLHGIDYVMPVASAQVKSALLLAGLYARGETCIEEPAITRDHTERMLAAFGCPVARQGSRVSISGGRQLHATRIDVPGDLSSAAFFILAGCIAGQGELILENVGLNPTRTGVLEILARMNADIEIQPGATNTGEPSGLIVVRPSRLRGTHIPAELVPLAIDELPLVFVAAALAEGETVVAGAQELRHKESDRIKVMVDGLRRLEVAVEERADGAIIQGGTLAGGDIDSAGDHRVAMAFAAGAAAAAGAVRIRDAANVATSFPDFVRQAGAIGLNITAVEHA